MRKDSGVKSVAELNSATVCMAQGTTHEQNASEWFALRGLKFQPVIMGNQETMYQAFFNSRCDALSQDRSPLVVAIGVVSGKPHYAVLPDRISRNRLVRSCAMVTKTEPRSYGGRCR